MTPDPDVQFRHLVRNADRVVPEEGLLDLLRSGRPLRVKLGVDPTAPAVTLGWAVVLRKLREFQDLGHTAVLIVGDFTAQVGDPSLQSEARRRLSAEEVRAHAQAVLDQFRVILAPERLEIRFNSEWLAPLTMNEVLDLSAKATVAQLLEREDFSRRFEQGVPISMMEFMYPLLQAYDSVAVRADVELGGSDQLWNLMMGRTIQERYGQPPQVAMTMPLLVGTDGEHKMSQSLGNYIGITDPPSEMFGKTMSIPDHVMVSWFRLVTDLPTEEIDRIEEGLQKGELHPGEVKRRLAREIVGAYHGQEAAEAAEAEFDRIFREGRLPDEIPEHPLGPGSTVSLPAVLREAGLVGSAGEARRLIAQGGVKIDGEPVTDLEVARAELVGRVVQVGKRRFVRLV